MNLLSMPVFDLYAVCCAILVISLYALGFLTAKKRADCKAVINYEDVKVNSGAKPVDVEHVDVQRIKRAHLNAMENAVPFFVIGFLYCLTGPSMGFASALFIAFVVIRLFHAFFYLSATQPYRTASFAVGAGINLIMVIQVLRAAIPMMLKQA